MIHRIIDDSKDHGGIGALTIVITLPGAHDCCNLWSHEDFDENDQVETAKMHVDEVRHKLRHVLRCLSAGSLDIPDSNAKRPATMSLHNDTARQRPS